MARATEEVTAYENWSLLGLVACLVIFSMTCTVVAMFEKVIAVYVDISYFWRHSTKFGLTNLIRTVHILTRIIYDVSHTHMDKHLTQQRHLWRSQTSFPR